MSKQANKYSGLSLVCMGSGAIHQVLQDDLHVTGDLSAGVLLTSIVAQSEFNKVLSFLADINANGMSGSWEINTPINEKIMTLNYTGCKLGSYNLVVATSDLNDLPAYFNMVMGNLPEDEAYSVSDNSILNEAVIRGVDKDFDLHNEMSRLNNELVNTQRELHKKNRELEDYKSNLENIVKERTRDIETEIIERKQIERALKEAEDRYRTVADFTYDWEYWKNPDQTLEYISPSCKRITGYSPQEFIDDPGMLESIILPEDLPLWKKHASLEQEKPKYNEIQFRIRKKNGEIRWVEHASQPVVDRRGIYKGVRCSNRDITKRKEVEESLHHSENQLRALSARLETIHEVERTRIAREIHDQLGHLLAALKFDLAAMKNKSPDDRHLMDEDIHSMLEIVEQSINTTRKIAAELRPGILDKFGITAALEWQLKEFVGWTGMQYTANLEEIEPGVGENESTALFRIFQEILTNVAMHSGATEVHVTLKKVENELKLNVSDNGRGISRKEIDDLDSLGILGMRERARNLGGKFRIHGAKGKGTSVNVSIPVQ